MLIRLAAAVCILTLTWASTTPCRDRRLLPFSSGSIWNMPIGTGAAFVAANIYTTPNKPPASFHNDQDFYVIATAADPLVDWVDQGDWGPDPKCVVSGKVVTQVPLPEEFNTTCEMNNNSMGLLLPDNVTLLQMQPAYRNGSGSPFLARYQAGCPVPFPFNISIMSDGALGAHGGSGLSSVGGTIRVGELLGSSPAIAHALKLELHAHVYYYGGNASGCYTWPAVGCDSYAHNIPSGQFYNGSNQYLKPGALLAVPSSIAPTVRVSTVPGKKILAALTTYGGYICDDTADDTGAVCMDPAVTQELQEVYGFSVGIANPLTSPSPFYADLVAIFQALHVVSNNTPETIGGGGKPIGPIAPPICDM